MKALGANWPAVLSGGCSGSFAAFTGRRKASTKPPAKAPVTSARRDGSGLKFESASCECALCGFTTASYAWPSAARLIASRMRT